MRKEEEKGDERNSKSKQIRVEKKEKETAPNRLSLARTPYKKKIRGERKKKKKKNKRCQHS